MKINEFEFSRFLYTSPRTLLKDKDWIALASYTQIRLFEKILSQKILSIKCRTIGLNTIDFDLFKKEGSYLSIFLSDENGFFDSMVRQISMRVSNLLFAFITKKIFVMKYSGLIEYISTDLIYWKTPERNNSVLEFYIEEIKECFFILCIPLLVLFAVVFEFFSKIPNAIFSVRDRAIKKLKNKSQAFISTKLRD